jgi:hypothetical protein
MQAKVRHMILEKEQKARELEQQIMELQGEDPCHQQPALALNLNLHHPTYHPSHQLPSKG